MVAVSACDKDSSSSNPSISANCTSTVASYEGGEYGFGYTLSNSKSDGVLAVYSEEDWVYDFDLSVSDTVTFQVAAQQERVVRRAKVYIAYTYNAIEYKDSITVRQLANSYYGMSATQASGVYSGVKKSSTEGSVCYEITLSAGGDEYYYFDIWTPTLPSDADAVTIPEGTYSYGYEGSGAVFTEDSYYFELDDEGEDNVLYIVDGTIEVSADGIVANLEDAAGGTHCVIFDGSCILENDSYLSSLDEDVDLTLSGLTALYYGDYYYTGTANWVLALYEEGVSGFSFDICADSSYDLSAGIPVGTFTAYSVGGVQDTFLAGSMAYGYISGAWLVTVTDGVLDEPHAPIVSGTLVISGSSDAYSITIEGLDDKGNTITGSYSGSAELVDYTTTKATSVKQQIKL